MQESSTPSPEATEAGQTVLEKAPDAMPATLQEWWSYIVDTIWTAVEKHYDNVLFAILVGVAFWVGYRVSRPALLGILKRARFEAHLVSLLDNVYKWTLFAFGAVMALAQLGANVTAALTGLGVAGIAVGFAAQDTIANMIAGIMIFWDKPFSYGDWVTVADEYGEVREITLRTTRIRTNKNTFVVIPNKNIIDSVLINHSKHGRLRLDVPIGIAYKEFIPKAREVLLAAVAKVELVLTDPAPDVVVAECGASSVDLLVRVWIEYARDEKPVTFKVLETCKLALDAAGIQIPYPHLQLFVDDIEGRAIEKLKPLRA